VYDNTSTGTNGITTQLALNLVGEYGFLRKPGTNTDIDPLTGTSYRSEIESTIAANGFVPIDTHIATPFPDGSLPRGR
jgi:hypothetical protein